MRAYLDEFFGVFDYPAEARAVLLQAYDKIGADERFAGFLTRYGKDAACADREMLVEIDAVCADAGVHEYTGRLLLLICMSRMLKDHYRAMGIDEGVWKESMYDLKWKLIESHLVYGVWGSFVCDWLLGYFDVTRFAIGRMQFEIVPFKYSYDKKGVSLRPGCRVINTHIPRSGQRLDADTVASSYDRAAAFFRRHCGIEQPVFVCDSWLLFPRNMEVLSPESNIRRFASDYDIIDSGEYSDYHSVWRLFDTLYTGDVEALPQDSSFRRAYADWIRKGIKTGWGYGVYVYGK